MNKISILYISHTDKLSGGERSVFQYIQQLDREKYEPLLLCPASGMLSQFAAKHNVPVVFHSLRLFSKAKPWQYFVDLFWFIRFLRRENIQLMHGMNFYTAQLAGVASRLTGIPLVVHGQNIFSKEEAKKEVKRNCLRYCQKIIVCSQAVAEPLRPLLPKNKLVVLYHSISIPNAIPKKTYVLHNELKLSRKTKLVGHIGLLEERKCQDVLIHAANDVLQKDKDVAFLLVGDALFGTTDYKEKLVRLVHDLGFEKNIFFLGFRDDISKIIPELDIVTLPSYNEPLAMVTLEACSYARPYIGAYTGGTSEILRDKEDCLLVPPKDKEKLATAILYFLEHPKEAKSMGEKAREVIKEYCDVKKNSAVLFDIYKKLLQNR